MMFVIDIEGRGPSASRNGIVSIGVCVGTKPTDSTTPPGVIAKHRFDLLPLPAQTMDPKCKATFWDLQPNNLLSILQDSAVEASVGIKAFRECLDSYASSDPDLYILSDNPAYDFAYIDYYLDLFGHPTLAYKADLSWRPLHDADSYTRGLLRYQTDKQWVSNNQIASSLNLDTQMPALTSHMPEDDAEGIYRFHYALLARYL